MRTWTRHESQVEKSLASLRRDLRLAVRSSVGLTLTVLMDPDQQVTLTSIDHFTEPSDIVTSLRLPLNWATMETGSMIIFYAGVPGAFVDLAADLSYSLRLPPGTVVLDEDTAAPLSESGLTGAAESSTVNQAIGVLIDRGYTPATAGAHLRSQAGEMMLDLHHAASRVLKSASVQ